MNGEAYTINKVLLKEEINCDLCGGDNFISWDNWKNRSNPIYDATIIYQKQV